MANSRIRININEAIPVGGVVSFQIDNTTISYEWVVTRSGLGEVTAASTISATIANLMNAINADHPTLLTATYPGTGNALFVESVSQFSYFSNGQADELNVTFTYINTVRVIGAVGFSGNNYLINNDIIMDLASSANISVMTLQFNNLTTQELTPVFRIYPYSNLASVNLSPIIKGIFSYPEASADYSTPNQQVRTTNEIRITVNFPDNSNPTYITKNYVRGGNRTNDTNQTIANGTWLTPSDKIPVWSGYPVAGYYLDSNVITKKLLASIPANKIDTRRRKGCNELYVKFLNQMGGYSYWLFDSQNESESNINQGAYIRNNRVEDLGNESENKMTAYGKIPREYIGLIKDLIVSPEILIYDSGNWVRVLSGKNTITEDYNKRAYSVKINFDLEYRFNPSLLHSN